MEQKKIRSEINQALILQDLIEILEDMTLDWDMEFDSAVGPDTRLIADLAFESVDVVQFVVAIEEHYQQRGIPWEEFLMIDGRYVDEIRVGDTVAFLYRSLNNHLKGA